MPYSFNPFTGNFDNTPSTLKGDNAYSNLQSNSATWVDAYDTGTVYKANSASYATIDFANNKFFPLTGGQITGNTRINGNVTIFGDLTSTGTQTFANTIFSTTSSLSIVHVGSGPAVWVGNNGSGDIASFNDLDQGIEVFHIGGANGDFPNVGVKTSAPNKDFTVKGELSASSDIWTSGRILSGGQELASIFRPDIDKGLSVFNTVQTNSATNWNYQGTDLKNLSSGWVGGDAAFTNLVANSAAYISSVDLSFLSVSADWNSVYNTVQTNSATDWNYQGTDIKSLTSDWQTSYEYATAYSNASGSFVTYETGDVIKPRGAIVGSSSDSNVVDVSQTVLDIKSLVYGVQVTTSPDQVNFKTWNFNPNGSLTYPDNTSQTTAFTGIPSYVESTYSTVQSNSASWDYQGTDLKDLSANWQNTYTDFSSNSASYATSNFVQTNFLPLSGGSIQGNISTTGGMSVGDQLETASLYASGGKVGINTELPNKALTVVGDISSTGTIYTNYLELSDVKFTNEYATNVNSVTASNDFLKVFVGSNIKYLRLYDVE